MLVTLTSLVVTGCANAKSGKGIADGDEAAAYVSAKFAESLRTLTDNFGGYGAYKSRTRHHIEFDDETSELDSTAIQVGSPPTRYVRNEFDNNPSKYLVNFHPARSQVKYLLLGPHYSSIAETPWVSMPYRGWNLGPCIWQGYQAACKMISAVVDATERGNATKKATSLAGGSVKLQAEITLRDFLRNEIIIFPDDLLSQITEKMKGKPIKVTILLGPDDELKSIAMNATITGAGHRIEIHMRYEVLPPPPKGELPDVPAKQDVTALENEEAVDDLYQRLGEL